MRVHSFAYRGKKYSFAVENPLDEIQKHHASGRFYEQDWLEVQGRVIPLRGVVIDVGANVGNHTVWYLSNTEAEVVIPIEPNPAAQSLLAKNLQLNESARVRLEALNFDMVNYACGERLGRGVVQQEDRNNLGGAVVKRSKDGPIQVAPLDDLVRGSRVDFIKIDAEGMECEVLAGASGIIGVYRPALSVEIGKGSREKFFAWLETNRYVIVDSHCGYRDVCDYLVTAKEPAEETCEKN